MRLFSKFGKIKENAVLQAVEYKHFAALRLISLGLIGIFAISIISVGFFIYQHIYTVVGQVQSILVLESQLGAAVVDFNTLEKVEAAWQEKYSANPPLIARDPFSPANVAALEEESKR
ncbi:MAG: hypothetical protein WC862_00910 [Patescibacteria group bacterium]